MPWSETLRKSITDENDLAEYFVYLYTSPIKMYRDTKLCKYFIGGLGQRYISIQLKNGKNKLVQSWSIVSEAAYNIIKERFPKFVDDDKKVVLGHFPRELLKCLRFEHIIPSGLIHDRCLELAKEGKMNHENALKLIQSIYIALVTIEEDKALTRAGFRDKLPEGYDQTFSDLGLSRYEKAGIILHKW